MTFFFAIRGIIDQLNTRLQAQLDQAKQRSEQIQGLLLQLGSVDPDHLGLAGKPPRHRA
jgi:hypothetical protein